MKPQPLEAQEDKGASQNILDLFESAGVAIGSAPPEKGTAWANTILFDANQLGDWIYNLRSTEAEGETRLISYVVANQSAITSWGKDFCGEEQLGTCTPSLGGSFQLLIKGFSSISVDALDLLSSQIGRLHGEFSQWPGSYNQLLLAGSLDYCKSALLKASRSQSALSEDAFGSMRNYYAECLGILDQYRDAKGALRRLNLQKIQDRFEVIQDNFSKLGIYPRLAELDLTDIPSE